MTDIYANCPSSEILISRLVQLGAATTLLDCCPNPQIVSVLRKRISPL
ncbi:MAG: hypothetical protein LBD85_03300 [Oscillospiraceae bacterium]|nr:hypothetical protein [Oscillospiraceae bacterium]